MARVLPREEIKAIFRRFPEGNPYNLPLRLAYEAGFSKAEAFGVTPYSLRTINGDKCIKVLDTIEYDRKDNQLYFVPSENVRYVRISQGLTEAIWKVHKQALNLSRVKDTPVYYCGSKGRLNTKEGIATQLLNVRLTDGTFVSPQGINHVARVIHGKKGKFDYIDPDWKFEDMAATGFSEKIWSNYEWGERRLK